jgi:hypothetical protein
LKPVYKLSLAAFGLFLVVIAYGVELFVLRPEQPVWVKTPVGKEHEVLQLAKLSGIEFDTRTDIEVIADFRKRGIDAVPQVILPMLEREANGSMKSALQIDGAELIPLGGIANKLTVMCNQIGDYVVYKTDEHGFHNPAGIWDSGQLQIVALGNSFTHGYCVPSEKNFAALIRRRYPATLNLAMAGHGPMLTLATVKEYLPQLKPKTILWFYFEGNQLSDLQREKKSPLLMRYLEDNFSQDLLGRQTDIDRVLMNYSGRKTVIRNADESPTGPSGTTKLLRTTKLTALRHKLHLTYGSDAQAREIAANLRQNVELLHGVLSQAKKQASAWGGSFYFVYLPTWWRYANDNSGPFVSERPEVLKAVHALGIPLIDILPAFEAHSDPLSLFPFGRFYHYNEQGHRIVAAEVLKLNLPQAGAVN